MSETKSFRIGSRSVLGSPVLATYWRFAVERQAIYYSRLDGNGAPWSGDPVLSSYRFTNAFRAADRVSQILIQNQYSGPQDAEETVFRTLLFKIFNRTRTWDCLVTRFGNVSLQTFDVAAYSAALDDVLSTGQAIYSSAYIMPMPAFGARRKHTNHLLLLEKMLDDGIANRIAETESLQGVYELLLQQPSIGPFLAYQLAIDLNYSQLIDFDEDDFVVAGPGARSGIAKCFLDRDGLTDGEIIRWMVDSQEIQCRELGLSAPDLFGRRLKLIDCQNLFCETDKYARVMHPEIAGLGQRVRIKQKFAASEMPLAAPFFPPKWDLATPASRTPHLPATAHRR